MANKGICKYNKNLICEISSLNIDTLHCNSCVSFIEKNKCNICEERIDEENSIDTEGLINGGIGIVCLQCWKDGND